MTEGSRRNARPGCIALASPLSSLIHRQPGRASASLIRTCAVTGRCGSAFLRCMEAANFRLRFPSSEPRLNVIS
jgi:hypothetical protein